MILKYADPGCFNKLNFKSFNWEEDKLFILLSIIRGLKEIHQKNRVHGDFHTGNILISDSSISSIKTDVTDVYISDLGLCKEANNNTYKTKPCGVMPYIAPEVLRQKPYTQAADIYSFGMIMYFVATGRRPFYNRAHDKLLALDICDKNNRPEINEQEAPKCYIELMKKCWDSNPDNRPNVIEVEESISQFINSIYIAENNEIEIQFKEAEENRKANIKNYQATTHPQAIYISRFLSHLTKDLDSECLDCEI
jgi:serine/threonine protein kinase